MNLSKEHYDMYNEYTSIINKIKREVNAIIKRQKIVNRKSKEASNEEIVLLEKNKHQEIECSKNKSKIYNFSNGDIYIGKIIDGKMEGIGSYNFVEGIEYVGEFKENMKSGLGRCTFKSENVYIGNFSEDTINGIGQMVYKSKDEYMGNWLDGKKHGKGIYIWEEGKRYEGEFLHGKKHGDGVFYLNNELIYEGTWKFDKPCIFDRSLDELFTIKL